MQILSLSLQKANYGFLKHRIFPNFEYGAKCSRNIETLLGI